MVAYSSTFFFQARHFAGRIQRLLREKNLDDITIDVFSGENNTPTRLLTATIDRFYSGCRLLLDYT